MRNTTLQFTAIDLDGKKVYKPTAVISQLFCVARNVDYFDEADLAKLQAEGYLIALEEEALPDYYKKIRS
jgi:hypothetical protein